MDDRAITLSVKWVVGLSNTGRQKPKPYPRWKTLMAWLSENMPAEDDRVALVHGDYRLDNVMFHPTEPKIIAVLDWELSTLGQPYR